MANLTRPRAALDPTRAKAVLLLTGIYLAVLWAGQGESLESGRQWLDALLCFAAPYWTVQTIWLIRGDQARITPAITVSIGVWGYCWRSVVLHSLTELACSIILLFLRAVPDQPEASLGYGLLGGALFLAALPFVCWALFSRDRKGQLHWFLLLIR